MGIYRVTRPDGSVEYTDVPSGQSAYRQMAPPGRLGPSPDEQRRRDDQTAKFLMKEAQKRIPKIQEYLEYIAYLRTSSPAKFDLVMRELKKTDFQTWLKLQKYPQFRPLSETVIGVKAGERMIGLGIGSIAGNFTGSFEKFAETTLKSMMVRDGWRPEVLGAMATTLPAPAKPSYSLSRLGQWLKEEEAALARGLKIAMSELQASKAMLRAARGTAITRVGGTVLDFGNAGLDPENAHSLVSCPVSFWH